MFGGGGGEFEIVTKKACFVLIILTCFILIIQITFVSNVYAKGKKYVLNVDITIIFEEKKSETSLFIGLSPAEAHCHYGWHSVPFRLSKCPDLVI